MPRRSPTDTYQSVAGEAPDAAANRLLKAYDLAIQAAISHNSEGVLYCTQMLRSAIRAEVAPDLALSLTALYSDIETAAADKDFAAAAELLETMRGMWMARIKLDRLQHDS